MAAQTGPASLPQFEDRLLYHLVDLVGDRPLPQFTGAAEAELVARLADELGVTSEFAASEAFRGSPAYSAFFSAVRASEREGLLETSKTMGPLTVWPTRDGRRRVAEWRERWEPERQKQDRAVQQRILEELDRQRQASPERHQLEAHIDVPALCEQLNLEYETYLANAQRLREQGKIADHSVQQHLIRDGYAYITESGIRALEAGAAAERPRRDAQEAWVEVARLKRELQLARRTLPSLIADPDLRRRCEDLLTAGPDYDRVVREACVVLEDRVRTVTGLARTTTGTPLMEQAFSPGAGPLQLSPDRNEQLGAMQLYRGVIAFFRNVAGHHLIDTYTQDDALRFVAWVDLLLKMVAEANAADPSPTSP